MKILLYSGEMNKQYILIPICNNFVFYKNGFFSNYHIHPVYHLVFVLNGQGCLISDTGKYLLKEKDIFIVNPNKKHIYTSDHPLGMNHFTVNFYLIEARQDRLSRDSFLWENDIDLEKTNMLAETVKLENVFSIRTRDVFIEYHRNKWADILLLIESFCKNVDEIRNNMFYIISGAHRLDLNNFADLYSGFLTRFLDLISGDTEVYDYASMGSSSKLLNRIINCLNSSIYDSFHLSSLSEELNYSPVYLCSYFKRKTGITITQYFNRLKINKACEFLRKSDKTISEIASILNFSSSNHFSGAFKKEKKISPKHFRKNSEL